MFVDNFIASYPKASGLVILDCDDTNALTYGHFCSKELMDWSEDRPNIGFLTGLAGNAVLNRLARITVESAEREYDQYKKTVKRCHSFEYRAGSWEHSQCVVVKVEASSMDTNVRYIVSSLRNIRSKLLWAYGHVFVVNLGL